MSPTSLASKAVEVASNAMLDAKSTLLSKKLIDLVNLSKSCGLSSMGSKAVIAQRILDAVRPLPNHPWSIISLDIGIRNFAKAVLYINADSSKPAVLKEWDRLSIVDVVGQCSNPRQSALKLSAFVEQLKRYKDADYLIERQSLRGGGIRMIPGLVLKINMIETQLHCFLIDKETISVDPRLVANQMKLKGCGRDKDFNKKKSAVQCVDNVVKGADGSIVVLMDDVLKERYLKEKKKDDLADSLLQAIAHYQWRINLHNLHNQLL